MIIIANSGSLVCSQDTLMNKRLELLEEVTDETCQAAQMRDVNP